MLNSKFWENRDTPAVSPERGQFGYEQARDALVEIIGDGNVMLEWEKDNEPSRGNFGRLLAYVWCEENGEKICANVEMVRLGVSEYWTKYGEERYRELFEDAKVNR